MVRDKSPTFQTALIAALFTLLTAVGGYAFNAIDKRMTTGEERLSLLENSSIIRAEKVAALENELKNNTKDHLAIERKLDQLIEMHMKDTQAFQKLAAKK